MRALAAGTAAGALTAFWGAAALAADLIGQPTPGGIDLQPGVTPLRQEAAWFHNVILMPVIIAISVFVALLLLWCIVRYNKRANPIPARWSHNTVIEVIWTVVPVLILMVIAIFSFRLLFAYHDMPRPDLTVKATGYQWYWGYEYPDQKIPEFISNVLPEDQAKAKNVPFRLAATEPLVVPVNKVVRVLVTGADVIHAFAVPSFGIISDAVPGRVNETWFKADRTGIFYGSCRELCGVDHAFMPIEVHVVSQPEFDAWVKGKTGGKTPSPAAAAASAGAEASGTAPVVGATPAPNAPVNPAAAGSPPAPASTSKPAPVAAQAAK
jgi:cytochrome c oxidase subunit 2